MKMQDTEKYKSNFLYNVIKIRKWHNVASHDNISLVLVLDILKPSVKYVETKQNQSNLYCKDFINAVSIENLKTRKYQLLCSPRTLAPGE